MLPDSITVDGKTFQAKRRMSWGEVSQVRKFASQMMNFSDKFAGKQVSDLKPEDFAEINKLYVTTQESDMELMKNILVACYGFSQEELDVLDYATALELYNNIYNQSTQIKKKLDQTST